MKVQTYIIVSITASLIRQVVILVKMYVETFKIGVIVLIGNIIMCLMSY